MHFYQRKEAPKMCGVWGSGSCTTNKIPSFSMIAHSEGFIPIYGIGVFFAQYAIRSREPHFLHTSSTRYGKRSHLSNTSCRCKVPSNNWHEIYDVPSWICDIRNTYFIGVAFCIKTRRVMLIPSFLWQHNRLRYVHPNKYDNNKWFIQQKGRSQNACSSCCRLTIHKYEESF